VVFPPAFYFYITTGMFSVTRLASAVFNNVQAGLVGYTSTISLPMEQIEDAVV